jgi:hypothetical protein
MLANGTFWSSESSSRQKESYVTSQYSLGTPLVFTLNRKQGIALRLIYRQLDQIHGDERRTAQLCLFVGGEGGTGKSHVIETVAELFSIKEMLPHLLVAATSGTAAARINRTTIHFWLQLLGRCATGRISKTADGNKYSSATYLYVDGQVLMDQ